MRKTVLTLIACVLLCSCRSSDQIPPGARPLSIQLVHGPELRSYLSSVREQFYLTNPVLSDGSMVRVELISEMGVTAAKRLANGELKSDAWIAPSSSLINLANGTRINLGPEQGECIALFETPVLIAAKKSQLDYLGAKEGKLSWSRLIERALAAQDDAPFRFSFSHGQPRSSTTGLASLIQIAYLTAGHHFLSPDLLTSERVKAALKSAEQVVYSYPLSESFLLAKTAASSESHVRFALTTEQQLKLFNQQRNESDPELVAVYPEEGSYVDDYQLCISQANWVTPARRAALRIFTAFLTSEPVRRGAAELGFRLPSPDVMPTTTSIPETLNTPITQGEALPSQRFPAVSAVVITHLLDTWSELKRPAAIIMVLDRSGSMEGDALLTAKEQFRQVIAQSAPNDLKALLTFGSDVKLAQDFTTDSGRVFTALDMVQAVGGSSVYSGIKAAFELAVHDEISPYRKAIVVFTDGDDKNSDISLTSLLAYVHDKTPQYAIDLVMVAVNREGSNFSDLERLTQAADGTFRSATLLDMAVVFQDIVKGL